MYRIRITKPPMMARGGKVMGDQLGHGLFVGGGLPLAPSKGGGESRESGVGSRESAMGNGGVRSFVPEVPREMANIEAERGETVMGDFDQDGMMEHMQVGGQRHAQGGTPLQVPDGSFVFSDTKKLKVGGPVLQEFGKGANSKKKYTYAELAKQYDVNYFKKILNDPDSDAMERKTAELMLQNYQQKLAKLALLQEGMKGFPQGIPELAMPLVQKMMGVESLPGAPGTDPSPEARDDSLPAGLPIAAWGGGWGGGWGNPGTGPRPPKTRPLYEGDFTPGVYGNVIYPGYLPADHSATVPWVQQRRKDGLYGTQNWDMSDFYSRHPWVQQMRANFNPANPADVLWFQKEYDKLYNNLWNRKYFDGTGHRMEDGLFGQYTFSTPSVVEQREPDFKPSIVRGVPDYTQRGKVEAKIPYQPYQGPFNNKNTNTALNWKGRGNNDNRWWWQDRFNTGASLADYFSLQQDNPTFVSPNAVYSNVSLLDSARQVAAAQEAANSQNMMAGMFAGPQRWRAVGSNIQGQSVPNVANILGQVHNQNIGLVNANEMANVERANNNEVQRKVALKNYIDEWATVKQQARNSKAQALFNVRNNIVNAKTNADKRNWANLMNPYYNVDANGRIAFTGYGKGIHSPALTGPGSEDPLSLYNTYYDRFINTARGADQTSARDFAMKMAFANRSRYGVDSDGDSSMSMSGFVPPVQAQALMNMYGRG